MLLVFFARPIADDFTQLYQVGNLGWLHYIKHHLEALDGRYSNAVALATLVSIFHNLSVKITPLILLLGSIIVAYYFFKSIAAGYAKQLAVIIPILAFITAPSLFDSIYWMNSTTIYAFAIVSTLLLAYLLRRGILTQGKSSLWYITIAAAVGLVSGGFNEIQPFINILLIVLFLLWYKPWKASGNQKSTYVLLAAIFASQLVALYVLKYAPGSVLRQHIQQASTPGPFSLVNASFSHFGVFINSLPIIVWLLLIIGGFIIGASLRLGAGRLITPYKLILLICFCAACSMLPVVLTTYAHSLQNDGAPPYRVALYISIAFLIFFIAAAHYLLGLIKHRGIHDIAFRLGVIVGGIFVLILGLAHLSPLAAAMSERAYAYDQRQVIAKAQMAKGYKTLRLPQVPILYSASEAQDLPGPGKMDSAAIFVKHGLAQYYGVESIIIDNNINLSNCPYQHIDWYINGPYCHSLFQSDIGR